MKTEHRRFDIHPALWAALLMLCSNNILSAQPLAYQSAIGIGGSKVDRGQAIAVDANGNTYVTGYFNGSVDFDPGAGSTTLSAVDTGTAFVAKFDASGNLAWAFRLGGIGNGEVANRGLSIAVAGNGDIVVSGVFSGTADFNPGTGTFNLTARTGTIDQFIARYSALGTLLWAFRLPVSPTSHISNSYQHTMALDSQGNIVFVGTFVGTIDFDPSTRKRNVTASSTAAGCADFFVAKYSSAGAFVWAFGVGSSTDFETATAVAIDGGDNVLVTGRFGLAGSTTVDFNPATAVANVTAPVRDDIFVAKYSAAGAYRWAFAVGGKFSDRSMAIAADADDNVIVTGGYMDTVDFDPGTNVAPLAKVRNNPSEFFSGFVAKYSASGGYAWAIKMGNGWGASLAVDPDGNILVGGTTVWSWDLDPGVDTNIVGSGPYNGFVGSYDPSGNYLDAFGLDGSASHTYGIALDGSGGFYITGDFGAYAATDATDFDPSEGTATLSSAAPELPDTLSKADIYVARYGAGASLKRNLRERSSISNDIALRIAPNPFMGGFTLGLDREHVPSRVQITDVMGRVVVSRDVAAPTAQITLGEELPAGAYIVHIIRGTEHRSALVHKVR